MEGGLKKGKKGPGRPTKFSDKLAARIFDLARQGKTEREIARAVGISCGTLQNWKGAFAGFYEALDASRDVAADLVEAALFQRAIGYSHPAVKIFFDAKSLQTHTVRYREHYPPDTQAAQFYLKNRRPKRWRERQEVDHKGTLTLEQLVGGVEEPKKNKK